MSTQRYVIHDLTIYARSAYVLSVNFFFFFNVNPVASSPSSFPTQGPLCLSEREKRRVSIGITHSLRDPRQGLLYLSASLGRTNKYSPYTKLAQKPRIETHMHLVVIMLETRCQHLMSGTISSQRHITKIRILNLLQLVGYVHHVIILTCSQAQGLCQAQMCH